jgi:DnaJ like chaperone protein
MWIIILLILVLIYVLSPYDLFPDMAIGWGWIDDLVILGLLWRYLYLRKKKRETFQKFHQNSQNSRNYEHYNRAAGGDSGAGGGTRAEDASEPWDPYRILEIERGASQEEIKTAYRQLAGKYHPDKVEHLGNEFKVLAEKRFKEIQQAYQELRVK